MFKIFLIYELISTFLYAQMVVLSRFLQIFIALGYITLAWPRTAASEAASARNGGQEGQRYMYGTTLWTVLHFVQNLSSTFCFSFFYDRLYLSVYHTQGRIMKPKKYLFSVKSSFFFWFGLAKTLEAKSQNCSTSDVLFYFKYQML